MSGAKAQSRGAIALSLIFATCGSAGSPRPGSTGATPPPDGATPAACWSLPTADRVRVFPRAGHAAAMAGGTIQGSNDSATNGFVRLATLTSAPEEGRWTELPIANTTAFRWVKYCGGPQSYGQIAELELYAGAERLPGSGFGTAGSRSGQPWQAALDGDPSTSFDGPTPDDVYVGLDLAGGHVVAPPAVSPPGGAFSGAQRVTLATATRGAVIRYTLDGGDPAAGAVYTGPFDVMGTTTVRAIATAQCMQPSEIALAHFSAGSSQASTQSSLHVGNSLTDSVDGYLPSIAAAGGANLRFEKYTIPGAGTWEYADSPTGGFGVADVQVEVRTRPLDHLSFQPHPNMPCVPTGYATEPKAEARSDAVNIEQAWNDAVGQNPAVQLWLMEVWPPAPTSSALRNCITGGSWLRDPAIWNPAPPATWEDAAQNVGRYVEVVRTALVAAHPTRPPPYVLPTGRALKALKAAVEGGTIPGVARDAFFSTFYADDTHLSPMGRYFVTLVFYASMFRADPRALPDTGLGTPAAPTPAQAAALQQVAWSAVSGYAPSGYTR